MSVVAITVKINENGNVQTLTEDKLPRMSNSDMFSIKLSLLDGDVMDVVS